ncbi:hypothetical protein [Pseudomonas aeruginosa]|uniref:hypothetical protein n=1 Tax=Pseudomonas aeruginosa TaxID=287 RepID=UPI001BCA1849|nr:hypothetical protein [Pseudomonas aeruginosa]
MAVVACSQCGTMPIHRVDPDRGFQVYACPECKHRGEVSTSPARAQASWNLVNDADLPRHGCKAAPAPRFRQRDGLWGAYCSCGFDDAGYHSLEGARAGWARSLR